MREGKSVAVTMVGAAAALLIVYLSWPSCGPFEANVVSIEPSGIFDEAGAEFWLVSMNLSNQGNGLILLDSEQARIEAKVIDRWVGTPEPFRLSSILPGRPNGAQFLLPANANACRLHLTYSFRTHRLDGRFTQWTWVRFPGLYGTNPFGRELNRLYYSSLTNRQPPLRWRRMTTRGLKLPQHSTAATNARGRLGNFCPSGRGDCVSLLVGAVWDHWLRLCR
jgi:hypothetical protein